MLRGGVVQPLLKEDKQTIKLPNDFFFYETVDLAKTQFLSGERYSDEFNKIMSRHPDVAAQVKESTHHVKNLEDEYFPDGNLMPGTNFVAGRGQRGKLGVAQFFSRLLHHTPPIQHVMAFGYYLGDGANVDFYPYFIRPGVYQGEGYQIFIRRLNVPNIEWKCDAEDRIYSNHFGQVQLKVRYTSASEMIDLPVNLTFCGLRDNVPINLSQCSDVIKEAFIQIDGTSSQHLVFVNCAAGLGRTGHGILTLQLYRHFDEIFSRPTAREAAAKIIEIVNRLRKPRPGLIWTDEQFDLAIYNAFTLRRYAIEKGYSLPPFHPVLPDRHLVNWQQYLPPQYRPQCTLLEEKANLAAEKNDRAWNQMINELLPYLKNYRETIAAWDVTEACCSCLFSRSANKKKIRLLNAMDFFIALAEKKKPSDFSPDAMEQHKKALTTDLKACLGIITDRINMDLDGVFRKMHDDVVTATVQIRLND